MFNDIIINDRNTGRSWAFTPTHEGYCKAEEKIQEIIQKGHRPSGDLGRISDYFGKI